MKLKIIQPQKLVTEDNKYKKYFKAACSLLVLNGDYSTQQSAEQSFPRNETNKRIYKRSIPTIK